MSCSTVLSKNLLRPSVLLLVGFIFLAAHGTHMKVAGNPLPDNVEKGISDTSDTVKDFFERAKNTFSMNVDATHPGLSTVEIIAVVAAAIILFFLLFCCIGFCLCECIKELVCCICCCGCCRD